MNAPDCLRRHRQLIVTGAELRHGNVAASDVIIEVPRLLMPVDRLADGVPEMTGDPAQQKSPSFLRIEIIEVMGLGTADE